MPDFEKELDKYEKSVEDHVRKVSQQLDEELATINRKHKEKLELMRKLEEGNKKTEEENEKLRQRIETKKKKISTFEKRILKNKDNSLTFEATIAEINEKLPQREKQIEDILKALNEKRRQVLEKQNEYASFRLNRTENATKSKMEKTRKKLEEMRKKKIAQDKRISRLRADISKSEKSFDKIEGEIRKEIERQFENESKKEEIERRIRIFEVENAGITDEFQKLLLSLNDETKEKSGESRIGELKVMISRGTKYLEKLEEKIGNVKEMKRDHSHSPEKFEHIRKRSQSEKPVSASWKRLEDVKKQIIQLKRESEALLMNRSRLVEEKETLEKRMDEFQKNADRAAQELRNAENFRISELNQQERKLQPSILVETKEEKNEKEEVQRKEKLKERIELLEKNTENQKEELENIRRRSEFLNRQLKSFSEVDLVQFENDKTEKGAEIRSLKKRWHDQVITLNALNKKLQQRVLQREAAMTKANSVVHLTTNVREERNREIKELQKEMDETKRKL